MSPPKILQTLALIASATSAEAATGYKWTSRPLYVFAADGADATLKRQQAFVSASQGALRAREVIVVYVVGDTVAAYSGPAPTASAASLRKRFSIAPGSFRAVLVGKDGGVKLSSSDAISTDRLSAVIDAMPMRRQEMRRKG